MDFWCPSFVVGRFLDFSWDFSTRNGRQMLETSFLKFKLLDEGGAEIGVVVFGGTRVGCHDKMIPDLGHSQM